MNDTAMPIQFLRDDALQSLIQNLNFKERNTQSLSLLKKQLSTELLTDLKLYQSLSSEYDQFLQDKYLDNIHLVISGIDHQLFSSVGNSHLISKAHDRLQSLLFGSRLVIADSESDINVLWFPPIPINLMELEREQTEAIKQNIVYFFQKELGLMINKVEFSSITDGSGWEEFFYERYFLPKKFIEITGLSSPELPVSDMKLSIMDYIKDGKTERLKAQVNGQLPQQLKFDVDLPESFSSTDSIALFMPFVRVELDKPVHMTATETINLINQAFQVLECSEQDGHLTLLCMSPEGPYAETVTQIITNINELLCHPFTHFFNKQALEWQSLTFILTCIEL